MVDYIRDLRPAKWGSGVRLQGNNFKPLMSALGQKRRFTLLATARLSGWSLSATSEAHLTRCDLFCVFSINRTNRYSDQRCFESGLDSPSRPCIERR